MWSKVAAIGFSAVGFAISAVLLFGVAAAGEWAVPTEAKGTHIFDGTIEEQMLKWQEEMGSGGFTPAEVEIGQDAIRLYVTGTGLAVKRDKK